MGDTRRTDPGLAMWAELLADEGRLGPGRRFLDIGGGSGVLARAVAERGGAEAIVVDPHAGAVPGVQSVHAAAHALPVASGSVDAVLFSHVLHHLPDPGLAVCEAARVLRPGGRLLLRAATHADLRSLPHARWMEHLLPGILACVPDEADLFTWISEAGLTPQEPHLVLTPQPLTLPEYADSVALIAFRDWAASGTGESDPRERARRWALASFRETPPIRERLLVAERPAR